MFDLLQGLQQSHLLSKSPLQQEAPTEPDSQLLFELYKQVAPTEHEYQKNMSTEVPCAK